MTKVVKRLEIDETNERWGVNALSIVKFPAIEQDSYYFSKGKKAPWNYLKLSEEKGMLIGPALIPEKLIPRFDEEGREYDIVFSKETVEKAAYLYLERHNQHNTTIEHDHAVRDVFLVESWIKETELDKSTSFGFEELPIGTWFIKMKIKNDAVKEKLRSGEIKGISIEGMFTELALQHTKEVKDDRDEILDTIEDLLNKRKK